MGRVFRKTPQQTDGFRPERPQLGCEASNGRSGGPGIIWTLQKASKGCLAGETIQRMVYSPVSIGHLIGSVRWTTRKPSIGHFSECPIDGFHPGPAVEKKGSIVEKLFKRWSMVEKRSKNAARGKAGTRGFGRGVKPIPDPTSETNRNIPQTLHLALLQSYVQFLMMEAHSIACRRRLADQSTDDVRKTSKSGILTSQKASQGFNLDHPGCRGVSQTHPDHRTPGGTTRGVTPGCAFRVPALTTGKQVSLRPAADSRVAKYSLCGVTGGTTWRSWVQTQAWHFCPQGLLILPSDGWFGPTIRVQQYASRIQWMLLAGPRSDGIWYIRLGVQMPSTTPGGVRKLIDSTGLLRADGLQFTWHFHRQDDRRDDRPYPTVRAQ
ncbi:hypothetical protein PGT21_028091 [Puccinia graminis f. sp. tritici]|uniref:Uncharacterized protein n=1 Tax=Puccinia graminis f. sp. tritici TaxID=56615 RepID=A0A5B0NV56_PUCGR|nr:hypothetical protein PGT21_028091 [Puccinia graminis f. sp. tritici]